MHHKNLDLMRKRATQDRNEGRDSTMTTAMSTRHIRQREKQVIQKQHEWRPSYDDKNRITYKYRNSTSRWIEIRRSYLDEATGHHHTLPYQHLHHVRQPGTRGGPHRGYFRRQYRYGTRTSNTLVRQFSPHGRKTTENRQRRRSPT